MKLKIEPVKGVCKSSARLDNKIVLVTGGNTGIGLETARDLASRGAKVIIASRDDKKSAEAVADIIKTTENENVEFKYLNLASFNSIRKFAENFNHTYDRLDVLINNAGCGIIKRKASENGINILMQVNYLGPFLLTNLLLDKIKASETGRIINVSSYLYRFGFVSPNKLDGMHLSIQLVQYANSKFCVVMWTKALAKRLSSNVTVNSLHPGVVKTDIFKGIYPILRHWFLILLDILNFKSPTEGAQTNIYLAVSEEVANVSGKDFMDCAEAEYARIADNDEMVEKIWHKSIMLTHPNPPIEVITS